VVGHRWSQRSFAIRDFLASNAVPYRWYSADDPEGIRLLAAADAGPDAVPLLLTPDGTALANPSLTEVAEKVGLHTVPQGDFYDVIIIGGGPAGLGAAVYAASEGLHTVLIERQATGGQAGQSSRIENYLGFPDGVSGGQLTERARRQADKFGAEVLTARQVTGLEVRGPKRVVHFHNGSEIAAHTIILATGVAYRQLPATGVDDLVGRGVYYGFASTEAAACVGQHVVIVGGANSAGQAAVFFARQAAKVTLAVRGPSLDRGMSRYLVEQVRALDNLEVRTSTTVTDCQGEFHLECLTLHEQNTGMDEVVQASHVFIFIGAAPMTGWLPTGIRRDDAGFVLTGPDLLIGGERPPGWSAQRDPYLLETSVPGVFVAGDVRSQSVKRVASAVGEGALAVTLVHRYLEGR